MSSGDPSQGGVLYLPKDWRELLERLLAEPSLEKRREIVAHLDDKQKASLAFEWKMEREKRECAAHHGMP